MVPFCEIGGFSGEGKLGKLSSSRGETKSGGTIDRGSKKGSEESPGGGPPGAFLGTMGLEKGFWTRAGVRLIAGGGPKGEGVEKPGLAGRLASEPPLAVFGGDKGGETRGWGVKGPWELFPWLERTGTTLVGGRGT